MLVVLFFSAFLGAAGQVLTSTSTSAGTTTGKYTVTPASEPSEYTGISTLPPCIRDTAIPALESALNCSEKWPCVCNNASSYGVALLSLVNVSCSTDLPQFGNASTGFSDFCFQISVTETLTYTYASTTRILEYTTIVTQTGTALFCDTNF
jgi:hypothetical protein